MTIAPLEKIYWADIEEACLTFIQEKCCNIDEMSQGMDNDFIYGSHLIFTGNMNATSTMPYHDVTVTFTNNDPVCQVVTLETVRTQLRDFISINLGSLGSLGFIHVSTYASILNLYSYIAGFISARLVLIRHPFKDSTGYVFYNSGTINYAYYGSVLTSSTLSSTNMIDYLKNTFNNASYGSAYGSTQSTNIRARAILLSMTNECVTTGYPTGYATYESGTPGTYNMTISQAGVYDIHLVGAGGGAARSWYYDRAYNIARAGGGSGAYVKWWQYLAAGTYSVTIGAGGAGGGSVHANTSTGGNGGSSSFLSQTAGGGTGGVTGFRGTVYGTSATAGTGGTATTSFSSVSGNSGTAVANSWGVEPSITGGASVYSGYGAGSASEGSSASNGGIVLFYKNAVAPAIFESSTAGTYPVTPTRTGVYEVVVVGAGGGGAAQGDKYTWKSSSAGGGSGAYVKANITLTAGVQYQIVVGAGGAGHGGGWTQQGDTGGSSSFSNLITCTGGGGGYAAFTDGTPAESGGSGGTYSIGSGVTLIASSNGVNGGITTDIIATEAQGGTSVYGGYGAGGNARATGHNAGYGNTGGSGYVCIRQLSGTL